MCVRGVRLFVCVWTVRSVCVFSWVDVTSQFGCQPACIVFMRSSYVRVVHRFKEDCEHMHGAKISSPKVGGNPTLAP